ncbi:Structural maintenance of chromosomes protein 6 [Recurvomyces mirabilis]|uniref:Structural maintenance of chromosomes protein 6 n=1 Tax=Recurvomyces mirabilis TaxID=574656 RepID=A0AAE0WST0_9PEZI|nr:Structural maintenance of chromosomes protein 6 [Recurvomyces mirabilis]KAK5159556.1 Structural maintenance of chromosomes protein 6 [Recurvomyces mirabilis]
MSGGIFAAFRRENTSDTVDTSLSSDHSPNMSSGQKRGREANDIDGEIEIEGASSALRHFNPKRSRIQLATDHDSERDEEEDEDQGYQSADTLSMPDVGDLDDDGDDDDGDIDELRATQIIERQINQHRENMASEAGVIEEVFCRNFMCHTKLRIRFGPLINFIIGHNGSGKSAVLTALTMCLGGSARNSNRGKKLESMIKEGEESGSLAVKIKNQGDGAFRPELYGDSITVERHFTRGRGGGYKIKNAQDKVIGTKSADVQTICDFFAFQLDNPINVLSQDMARQFLSNSTPSDKYKFFMRGTQLETLDRDYNQMQELLEQVQIKLSSRKEDIDVLNDRFTKAESRKRRLDEVSRLGERLADLKRQHAWIQVGEQEDILERYVRDLGEGDQTVREKEGAAETVSGAYDGHDQAHEAATRRLDDLKNDLTPIQERRNAEKENHRVAKATMEGTHHEQAIIREHLKKAKALMLKLEQDVANETARIAGAEGAEYTARLGRLDELKAVVQEKKVEQSTHAEQQTGFLQNKEEAAQSYESTRQPLDRERDAQRNAERRLADLQQSQGLPFAGYRPNIEQLVKAVNQESRWRQKPVGPMGRHVKLLKPQWSSQLEKTFGGVLESFIVTNAEDQKMFRDLARRVKCDVPVYIGNAEPLDTSDKMPEDTSLDTILSVLTIDNDLVRNQLIINQAIEQTLLIEGREQAGRILYSGGARPRNVRAAISLGNKIGAGVRQEYTRSGQAKSSFIEPWTGHARMQVDKQEQIQHQRHVVDQHKRAFDVAQRDSNEKRDAVVKADQDLTRWSREAAKLKSNVQRAEDAVEEQDNEIESTRIQDGKLQELQRQLVEAKEEREAHERSYGDVVVQKDLQGAARQAAKASLDVAEQELNEKAAHIAKAEERSGRLHHDRHDALLAKNRALEEIDAAKVRVTQLEKRRDDQQAVVDEFNAKASEISRRVPIDEGMTPHKLDETVERVEREVKNQERLAGGTREELTLAWQKAREEYENAKHVLSEMKQLADLLGKALSYRRYRWGMFRRYIAYRARTMFKYLLSERQFRGHVVMSHPAKTLDIAVEPDMSKASTEGREARTLSGGEKSFSTICLLLSIWEAMGSPIRCLDEFDVFMDSVNRATSMGMMINAARRSVGRQFVLITPQAMGNVELGDDVRVHKMSDPERGQGVLPFTQS